MPTPTMQMGLKTSMKELSLCELRRTKNKFYKSTILVMIGFTIRVENITFDPGNIHFALLAACVPPTAVDLYGIMIYANDVSNQKCGIQGNEKVSLFNNKFDPIF